MLYSDQHNSKWVIAEIESVLEEMIRISYHIDEKEQNALWLSKDNENLAPHQSMQTIQRQIENEFDKIELNEKGDCDEMTEEVLNNNNPAIDQDMEYHKEVDSEQSDIFDNL